MTSSKSRETVLVTGVSGSIDSRLVPRFFEAAYQVRVLVPGKSRHLSGRAWKDQVEVVFRAFSSLGGKFYWPPHNWLWLARGIIDRLACGAVLDFWRV